MASFWSDRLVNWIGKTTDVTEDVTAMTVKEYTDEIVDRGKAFIVYINNDDLQAGTSQLVYLKTPPDTHKCYLSVSVVTSVESTVNPNKQVLSYFNIFEAPTISDIGVDTDILIANLNRDVGESQLFQVKNTPTVSNNGTQITKGLILSGVSTARPDVILKPDTEYLLQVFNDSTVDAILSWNFVLSQLEKN